MQTYFIRKIRYVLGALLLSASQVLFASGVVIDNLPTVFDFNGEGWVVGSPNNPVPVIWDPTGPVWTKFAQGLTTANVGDTFPFTEHLLVEGTTGWIDWHEEFVSPGWSWVSGTILVNGVTAPGLSVSNTGDAIWFLFDEVAAGIGNVLTIEKLFTWNNPATPFPGGNIEIIEYPTVPIPAAIWLFASGIIGLVTISRYKKGKVI